MGLNVFTVDTGRGRAASYVLPLDWSKCSKNASWSFSEDLFRNPNIRAKICSLMKPRPFYMRLSI